MFTTNQKQVIDFNGGNLLVSASAGSGKTTVMLERVIRLISEGGTLKRMLISTFTNSAAADMRAKLTAALAERFKQTGDRRYLSELDYLPTADICTMHKWCQKLIKKYFYITGDDPAFDICDEKKSKQWKREAARKAIAAAAVAAEGEFAVLCDCYMSKSGDDKLQEIILQVLKKSESERDAEDWIVHAADHYANTDECIAFLSERLEGQAAAINNSITELEIRAKAEQLSKAPALLNELRALISGADVALSRADGIKPILDEFSALRERAKAFAEKMRLLLEAQNEEAGRDAKLLLNVALSALRLYNQTKKDNCSLDFADLERGAKRILMSEAGNEVRASLDAIFIDEYQDINPLQESIIELVGRNNLFFVGDIKQSIYAFRNCSPDAFSRKRELLEPDGVITLNKNFRSKQGILRFVNVVFSRIMTMEFGKEDYAHAGAFTLDDEPDCDNSVQVISPEEPEKMDKKADFESIYSLKDDVPTISDSTAAAKEAEAVAEKIVQLLQDGKYRFDDIVVLSRARGASIVILASTLRSLGIPITLDRALGISEGRMNKLLVNYLKIINNFKDDIALAGVMRSQIGGFSGDELCKIRAAQPKCEFFYECVLACAEMDGFEKLKAFLSRVEGYTQLSRVVSVGELAGQITTDNKLFAAALADSDGASKAEGLGQLLSTITAFSGSLSEYLDYLTETEPEADIPHRSGSIRIMTVHASKGLEFPIVLLCGLSKRFKQENTQVALDSKFGLGLESRSVDENKRIPSVVLLAARERLRRQYLEEEMRILYVAMTRAKEKLILCVPRSTKTDVSVENSMSYSQWLAPFVSYGGNAECIEQKDEGAHVESPPIEPFDEQKLVKLKELLEKTRGAKGRPIKKSVTSLISSDREDVFTDSPKESAITLPEYESTDALSRGTAYHKALELFDFSRPFDEQWQQLSDQTGGLVSYEKIRAALSHLSKAVYGGELYREQPFIYKNESGLIIQGIIDAMIIKDGEAHLIDYKSGFITDQRLQKYKQQLDIYADAVTTVLKIPVRTKQVYLIDEGRFILV